MRLARRYFRRLSNFVLRRRADTRLREEIEWHLEILTEENLQAGMSREEARRHARLQFGAVDAMRDHYRDEESIPTLENLLLDIRYAVRVLRKSSAFTLVAFLTVTLGIATNVFVFGIVNAVMLRPLDVSSPGTLYQLRSMGWLRGHLLTTSYPAFLDFRGRNSAFTDLAAYNGYSSADLQTSRRKSKLYGYEVTANYFDFLGVPPALGRFFHESDAQTPQKNPPIVLSDALWHREFQGDTSVVGSVITLKQHPFYVIGVAPPSFHGTERFVWPDYWLPIGNEDQLEDGWDYLHDRNNNAVTVLGRLKSGVTPEQAAEDISTISAALAKEHPDSDKSTTFRLVRPGLYGDEGDTIRGFLSALSVLALLMLGAICANLASLSNARFADRRRELAIRVSLGAGRLRLIRQLLLESILIALAGGTTGVLLGVSILSRFNEWQLPLGHLAIHIGARVYLTGLCLTLGSVAVFGVLPAWKATRRNPWKMMKGIPRRPRGLRRILTYDLLLGVQVAICSLLIMASFIALRGATRTLRVPLGFQPHGALLIHIDLSHRPSGSNGVEAVLTALSRISGVWIAGATSRLPMTGGLHGKPVFYGDASHLDLNKAAFFPYVFEVSPGFLQAAGTRLLAGRDLPWGDPSRRLNVALINDDLARRMWPSGSAIGQELVVAGRLTRVIGITETGRYHDLEETHQPVVYLPLVATSTGDLDFVVRSQLQPHEIATQLERSLNTDTRETPLAIQSWDSALKAEVFPIRVAVVALGFLGFLAGLLAVTGIFGVATYSVSRRMKEFGVLVALGARRTTVLYAAIGRTLILLIIGSILGITTGVLTAPVWGWLAYEARPNEPAILGETLLAMLLLGLVASAIPVRRALSVNPARIMRQE